MNINNVLYQQVQQRFPKELLTSIDNWSNGLDMTRTAAINHMCREFLANISYDRLRNENAELKQKISCLSQKR